MKSQAPRKQRILVTGSHRSGTTWVGTMLTANRQVEYINEPLNVSDGPPAMRGLIDHPYQYICADNEARYLGPLAEVFRAGCMAEDCKIYHAHRGWTVIKDPFALFSSLWFAERIGCQVVIVVRRPEGFVSSLKRLQWQFDLRHLLDQPLLMRNQLESYRKQMKAFVAGPQDIVGVACLLWNMVYAAAASIKRQSPETIIVRHEDLSLNPMAEYLVLHERLGLEVTDQTRATIALFSTSLNPKETTVEPPHLVRLDSRANLDNWKSRLTTDEIARIRDITGEVAGLFYSHRDLGWPEPQAAGRA